MVLLSKKAQPYFADTRKRPQVPLLLLSDGAPVSDNVLCVHVFVPGDVAGGVMTVIAVPSHTRYLSAAAS